MLNRALFTKITIDDEEKVTIASAEPGLKDKKSWWRVSPSCFGGGLCGGGRARRWRRPIWG